MLAQNHRIVIVGAGQAGGWVAKTLRTEGFLGRIVMVAEEPHPPYERPPLSKEVLRGEQAAERCYLWSTDFAGEAGVDFLGGQRASRIDRQRRTVILEDGTEIAYDKLVLATGSRVRRLRVPGADSVLYLRDIRDCMALRAALERATRVAIIGGGWIGLEVAASARTLGVEVTVIEALPRLCARAVSPELSELLLDLHRQHGVDVRLSANVAGFVHEGGSRVMLGDGTSIPVDVVVAGIGIQPNMELADNAGIATADGVIVDVFGQTSDPDVYAAGDVTYHPNPFLGRSLRLESWANAQNQAIEVGKALLGRSKGYSEVPWFWSDQYDVNVQILGLPERWPEPISRGDVRTRRFSWLYLGEDGALQAVVSVNSPRDIGISKRLMSAGAKLDRSILANPSVRLDSLRPHEPTVQEMAKTSVVALCEASAVEPGSAIRAELNGHAYAVFNVNGAFHVSQDDCTHGPGKLSEGQVFDNEIECPFHQGRFDLLTGRPTYPPCTEPIKIWKAQVIDGKVCIDPGPASGELS